MLVRFVKIILIVPVGLPGRGGRSRLGGENSGVAGGGSW